MPAFQITGPDGKKYRVTGESPEGAMSALRKMLGAGQPAQHDAPEYMPPGVEGYNPETGIVEPQVGRGTSFLSGAADTASFGFGDELAAGVGSLLTGEEYGPTLESMRVRQRDVREANPGTYLAGQVTGGVAQGLAAGPGIMASAPSIGGRVVGGMLTGGGMGGVYGAGSGETPQDRIVNALVGTGTGAAAGGAFPVATSLIGSSVRGARNFMAGRSAGRQTGYSPAALRAAGDLIDADDVVGPQGGARTARAGPDAMIADAGPRSMGTLDAAIQRTGGGRGARQAITDRVDRASQAITKTLDDTLGAPEGAEAARAAIREGSVGARGDAYRKAYGAAIDYADPRGMHIEQLVKGRVPASAIQRANALMRAEGEQSRQILARVADDGSVTFERLPDVRQLDYVTRALNDLAESGEGAGALGGQTALGRAYQGLSREIRSTLRDLVPEYGKALETAADPIRRSKAVEFGTKLISMPKDQVREFADDMTGPERNAAAQGFRSHIDHLMGKMSRSMSDPNTDAREAAKAIKDLSSRNVRENVSAVIGEDAAKKLFDDLDQAATAFELQAAVAENSKTFARGAFNKRLEDFTAGGPVEAARRGEPIGAVKRLTQGITGRTPEAITREQDQLADEIASILTQSPGGARGVLDAVQGLGQQDQATQLIVDSLTRNINRPGLSYPASGQAVESYRR